ncbi:MULTISPECIES: hypothetical protein [unclassified Maribacter]|mgnify:FL=1|nr:MULTISPECIES: hypothetical protein [unclassified Maribacter]
MDYTDVASIAIDDLKDMCLMALTDNDPEKTLKLFSDMFSRMDSIRDK